MSFEPGWRTILGIVGGSMPETLSAHVIPEHGSPFDAKVANLATSSLFIRTKTPLEFQEAVTLTLGGVSVHGEVAFVCQRPPGAVVVFRASADAVRVIEDLMEECEVVVGGRPTTLEDLESIADEPSDHHESDPEGPTNTEGKAIEVADPDEPEPVDAEAVEVREAFVRAQLPRFDTELHPDIATLAALSAARDRSRDVTGDVESTLVPEPAPLAAEAGVSVSPEDAGRFRAKTVVSEPSPLPPEPGDSETDLEAEASEEEPEPGTDSLAAESEDGEPPLPSLTGHADEFEEHTDIGRRTGSD